MCGRYRDRKSATAHLDDFSRLKIPLRFPKGMPNLEPRYQVRPTNDATVIRMVDGAAELVWLRWWLVPWFHRGGLKDWKFTTFNARIESLATSRSFGDSFSRRRCLVSAEGWYEWTGLKGSKQMHLLEPDDGRPIAFAGIWDRCETADQGLVESFTIVTQPAGPPLNAIHDRAPVVLDIDDWPRWLDLEADVSRLLGPASATRFRVTPYDPSTEAA